MTFADLINSLLESSKERIKNPLLGSIFSCFIIYNWRPILFLISSNKSIEERILIINNEFCYPLALLLPILFGIIYTIYLPILMVKIDKDLEPVKKGKIENLYTYKYHTVTKKLDLAEKEFQLKNIESGNKDREDMLKEHEILKNENENLKQGLLDTKESNANIIKEITNQLKEAKEAYQNILTENSEEVKNLKAINRENNNELRRTKNLLQIIARVDVADIKTLLDIRDYSNGETTDKFFIYSKESIKKLLTNDLIEKNNNNDYNLTLRGKNVAIAVVDLNISLDED